VVPVVVLGSLASVKPLLTTLCAYNKETLQHNSKSYTIKYSLPKVCGNIAFDVLITNIVFL